MSKIGKHQAGWRIAPGEYYTAVFEVTQANGDYAVSIYRSEDNVTGDKKEIAEADGKKQSYQLEMIVYQ